MKDLLAKLEEAECGSPALNEEVALAVGWKRLCVVHFLGPIYHWVSPDGRKSIPDHAPDFTRSVDAALSLVAEGWRIAHAEDLLLGAWDVEVREINSASGHSGGAWVYRNHPARAATFPLAICSAALRARALMGGES